MKPSGSQLALWAVLAAPAVATVARQATGAISYGEAIHESGEWAVRLLIAVLAVTPLRAAFPRAGWMRWVARRRRDLGVATFGYALLHLAVYVFLDRALLLSGVLEDVVKRPFITVGFAAVLLMLPLALTSRRDSVRRMGFAAWSRLHYLVYPAVLLAGVHFYWAQKKDVSEPVRYALVLAALLAVRLLWRARRARG